MGTASGEGHAGESLLRLNLKRDERYTKTDPECLLWKKKKAKEYKLCFAFSRAGLRFRILLQMTGSVEQNVSPDTTSPRHPQLGTEEDVRSQWKKYFDLMGNEERHR